MSEKRHSRALQLLIIFVFAYLLSEGLMRMFFPDKYQGVPQKGIMLTAEDATIRGGHHPIMHVRNGADAPFVFNNRCPMPPVDVLRKEGETFKELQTRETVLPCTALPTLQPGDEQRIDLAPWKYSLFGEYGTYQIRLKGGDTSVEIELYEPGGLVKMFRVFITKPFLNALIWFASLLPDHSLGIGVIVLTLLVKLGLYFPTQHALQGQKRMQLLQPKIEALKKRYDSDREKLNQEMMKLWKAEGINPFSSFLPMLLQFPILIGLFFVIRDGAILELSQHLLYAPYKDLSWTFGTTFLWMDLTKPNITFFPLMLAALQFIQMKLSFSHAKAKQEGKTEGQELQQKVMLYALPLMIGFFAFQFPAAVSLYWGVSTLFAIGQQMVVNRKTS
ncbi:membrane protein insertase YidC [Candidatus Peregrinibacteria bacterium]|nr:membrane protein insertase YidC [Candidatus Peregrinibacteria bacterium]